MTKSSRHTKIALTAVAGGRQVSGACALVEHQFRVRRFVGDRLWAVFKTLLFTVLIPGSVTVLIPYYLLPDGAGAEFSRRRLLGLALIALGTAGYFWCAWNFAWGGLGTPAPIDPPKTIVARGLHRYVRNPMYVGVLTVLAGEAVLFASLRLWIAAVVGWLLFHTFVVLYEEPTLRSKFRASYEEYCGAVPRWIPRWRR